jgi:hypothetical protein
VSAQPTAFVEPAFTWRDTMKIVLEPMDIHGIIQDHVIAEKLLGDVDYGKIKTEFRDSERGWTGEIEASIEDAKEGEKAHE